MIEQLKENNVVVQHLEKCYVPTVSKILKGILTAVGATELDEEMFKGLLLGLNEKYLQSLSLTFDTAEEVEEYLQHSLTYYEEGLMLQQLTEKSTTDLLTEETLTKLIKL